MNQGKLIVSTPSILGDFNFRRSVILLASHKTSGSIGFILNKKLNYKLNDIVEDINIKFPLFYGGPVEQDNLYFIHTSPELIPNSIEIANGIYWGGDFKIVLGLINQGAISSNDIKFFLGYSGWDENQLDSELESRAWLVSKNTYKNSIVSKPGKTFWRDKMLEFGGDYSIWSNAPENPSYN